MSDNKQIASLRTLVDSLQARTAEAQFHLDVLSAAERGLNSALEQISLTTPAMDDLVKVGTWSRRIARAAEAAAETLYDVAQASSEITEAGCAPLQSAPRH